MLVENPDNNKKIFVDANVLIFIFCPISNASKQKISQYSKQLKTFKTDNRELYLDIIVLSEVINRWFRIHFNKQNKIKHFKDFRKSPQGQIIYKNIFDNVKKNLLGLFKIVNTSYESFAHLLNDSHLDFNDNHIKYTCEKSKFILWTDDIDFKNSKLKIISANPKLSK